MIRILALMTLALAGMAHGTEFDAVQLNKSTISFVSKQMNVPIDGTFRKFTAQINIDPSKPEAGRAQIEIDLASIDAGGSDANDEVKGKSWFNVREFPKASFASSSVKTLGGGRYETSGKMTLKGKTLETRAPFSIKQEKDALIVDGAFPLKRLDYGIGSGTWSDTSVVADEVQVKFHFVLRSTNKSLTP